MHYSNYENSGWGNTCVLKGEDIAYLEKLWMNVYWSSFVAIPFY